PDVVYAPNVALLKSTDGGKTFGVLKGQPGGDDYHELWIDPTSPTRMVVGSDQGTVITLDGGRTWSSWYNQPTAQFYHVVTDDAAGVRSRRPARPVPRRPDGAAHQRRRPPLGVDQPRLDRCRRPAGSDRHGPDHRRERRRAGLRRGVHHRSVAARRGPAVGRD